MKIIIIGAGEAGFYMAQELSEENIEVTIVDESQRKLEVVQRSLNVAGVRGNGTSLPVLEQAGITDADVVVACTNHDETNLISCLLATHYGVDKTFALTKTESYYKKKVLSQYLKAGVSQVVNSSLLTAQEVVATSLIPSAMEVSAFGSKNALLVGYRIKPESKWNNAFLKDIRPQGAQNQFLIASIVRGNQSFIPTGQDQIKIGDYVYILTPRSMVGQLNELLGVKIAATRQAVVAGQDQIALMVAMALLRSHFKVTLICRDEIAASKMKKRFSSKKHITVVHGDAESVKLQLQLDVPMSAMFVAVEKDDNLNIEAALVANYMGTGRTLCLVNRQDLTHIAELADIDVTISPRLLTARQIKKMIYSGHETLNYTTIAETNMEVREMIPAPGSAMLDKPLMELRLPENTLVGALIRGEDRVIIPSGGTLIEEGDKVIMVALPESVPKLQKFFEAPQD